MNFLGIKNYVDEINVRSDIAEEKTSEFEDSIRNYPASCGTISRGLMFSKLENCKPTDPRSSTNSKYMTHEENL